MATIFQVLSHLPLECAHCLLRYQLLQTIAPCCKTRRSVTLRGEKVRHLAHIAAALAAVGAAFTAFFADEAAAEGGQAGEVLATKISREW